MPEFTPEEAASTMNGATGGTEAGSSGVGAASTPPGQSLFAPLWNTAPSKPIPEICASEGVDTPAAYALRAAQKAAGSEGVPALADLAIALVLVMLRRAEMSAEVETSNEGETPERATMQGEAEVRAAGKSWEELMNQ